MIHIYRSEDAGAPVLNNAAASFIDFLRSVGVTGYNLKSIGGVTVSGGVATVTVSGHGFNSIDSVLPVTLLVSGVSGALDGKKLCTVLDANRVSFPAPGVADAVFGAGGQIKVAPFGLTVDQEAGNIAIFKFTDPAAKGRGLRVEHTATGNPLLRGIESWTSLSSYTNSMPVNGYSFSYTDTGKVTGGCKWLVVADERFFYFFGESNGYTYAFNNAYQSHFFWGDAVPLNPTDDYFTLMCHATDCLGPYRRGSGGSSFFAQRGPTQIGSHAGTYLLLLGPQGGLPGSPMGVSGNGPVYPNAIDGGLAINFPVLLDSASVRGHMPGLGEPVNSVASNLGLSAVVGASGKNFLAVTYSFGTSQAGAALFCTSHPWR